MIRPLIALASLTLLGACAPAEPPETMPVAGPPPALAPTPVQGAGQEPGRRDRPTPGTGLDQCGAARHQDLVGQNRSQLPQTPGGANWRVTCTTCAMTMDLNPRRLNVLFNQQTGVVEEVRCG